MESIPQISEEIIWIIVISVGAFLMLVFGYRSRLRYADELRRKIERGEYRKFETGKFKWGLRIYIIFSLLMILIISVIDVFLLMVILKK